MNTTVINNIEDINNFNTIIRTNNSNEIALDLEGENLCRDGKINFIQLFFIQIEKIFIFNCSLLGKIEIQNVLKPILENENNLKYMFDCRSDSDALYHQYEIKLKGVIDVQLFEIGYRKCSGLVTKYYLSLFKTLDKYKSQVNVLSSHLTIKGNYSSQFKNKNYEINLADTDALEYLAIDVIYLKKLYVLFESRIGNGNVRTKIKTETTNRENIWMNSVFINDKSNAISLI